MISRTSDNQSWPDGVAIELDDPTSPDARYADLMKQGIWKIGRSTRKPKELKPIVACTECQDWHRQGQHTRKPRKAQ
jgi:hypothetical protein